MALSKETKSNKFNKTHGAVTDEGSALRRYQQVIVGSESLLRTIYFEFCTWLAIVPGAAGLLLRKLFWPRMFGHCGKGVQFAAGIILRHPSRISLGDNVVLSEGVVLDARNEQVDIALSIGSDSMLSNQVIINCKGGTVAIGESAGIGAQTVIQSTNDCPVELGNDVIVGPRCYLVGGGSYNIDDLDTPIRLQGIKQDQGCKLADNIWIGANVTVLGNAHIKSGAVVAACALVNDTVEENSVVVGVPAKLIKKRQ